MRRHGIYDGSAQNRQSSCQIFLVSCWGILRLWVRSSREQLFFTVSKIVACVSIWQSQKATREREHNFMLIKDEILLSIL